MINDKIDTIISVATKNGISLNRNFNTTYLSTHGYYDGPQSLAEKTVADMEHICFMGMNAGFDGTLKGALDKLSDVVVNLTNVKNGDTRELSKQDAQRIKTLEGVRETVYPVKTDVRTATNEYISSSVDAIDTILSLSKEGEIFSTVDKRQIEYMEESKKKLGELTMMLIPLMDVSSVKAKENAEKINSLLQQWRRDASRFMCTGLSIKYLDDAKAVAESWGKMAVAPGKKDKCKEAPRYVRDEISVIAESRGGLETLSVFNARIQTRLAEVEQMRQELNADKTKCSQLKGELAGLENKKKEIAVEFKNTGNAAKANADIAELRHRQEELEGEIKSIEGNGRLARRDKDIKNRREIALHVKHICDTLTDNKSDLIFLAKVIKHVDFNALVGVMTGRTADVEEAKESILQIRVRVDALRQAYDEGVDILNDEEEITNSILEDEEIFEEEKVQLTEDGLDPELAALLKGFGGETEEQKTAEKTEARKIIPLGDDDK